MESRLYYFLENWKIKCIIRKSYHLTNSYYRENILKKELIPKNVLRRIVSTWFHCTTIQNHTLPLPSQMSIQNVQYTCVTAHICIYRACVRVSQLQVRPKIAYQLYFWLGPLSRLVSLFSFKTFRDSFTLFLID